MFTLYSKLDAGLLTVDLFSCLPLSNGRVELHPFLPQHDLVKFCQSKGILMQAYSPLGSSGGPVLQDSLVQSIAKAHSADPAQVVISWAAQRGVVALPKSVTPSRIETNGKLIELSDDEMLQLNELHKQDGKAVRLVKPNVSSDPEYSLENLLDADCHPLLWHLISGVSTLDGDLAAIVSTGKLPFDRRQSQQCSISISENNLREKSETHYACEDERCLRSRQLHDPPERAERTNRQRYGLEHFQRGRRWEDLLKRACGEALALA